MSLGAVKKISEIDNVNKTKAVFDKWQSFPVSRISHHGSVCCEIAREWIFAMDFSNLNGASNLTGPRWIRQRYGWGPTQWAIHWCEAAEQRALDCGAQSAIANEVLLMRGVRSYQVQLVQQYSKEATDQWSQRWNGAETSVYWINEDLIYHEGCAVVINENQVKLWDASAAWWINPKHSGGYGGLRALRLIAPELDDSTIFNWSNHLLKPNQWQEIKNA
jgi:hypothetical protein